MRVALWRARLQLSDMGQPQLFTTRSHRYSLLDGACETSELLMKPRGRKCGGGDPDHGNLFAAATFSMRRASATSKHHRLRSVRCAGQPHERGERQTEATAGAQRGRTGARAAITWCCCANRSRLPQSIDWVRRIPRRFLLQAASTTLLSKHSKG